MDVFTKWTAEYSTGCSKATSTFHNGGHRYKVCTVSLWHNMYINYACTFLSFTYSIEHYKSYLLYICPIYADSTNDSTETDDAIEAHDSASSVKIDLKHNFLAWQVSTCMCVTRDWIILYSCAVYTHDI